jgi:carboxyl-terminal processing protease
MKLFKIILFSSLITCSVSVLHGQTFYNLDFEQRCDSSKTGLCHWDNSWGGKDAITPFNPTGKNQSLLINIKDNVGFAEQTAPISETTELRVISFSGKIKSENIEGKGAGLNIGIYDSSNNLLFTKDMGYASFNWVVGTKDWNEYTIGAVCPPQATKIKIGAILYGTGKAWFDDFKVDISSGKKRKPSKLANKYISAAIDTVALHSLMKDSLDIKSLKNTALQIAGNSKKYSDCYLAITYLLESLGDHHSFFMTPQEVKSWESDCCDEGTNAKYPSYKMIDSCGYISVPYFHGGNQKLILAFADTLQNALRKLNSSNIKGWIIDLRENTGGNMEPMLAGLGPIFNSEKLGSLVDVNGKKESWSYKDGTYFWENKKILAVSDPVKLSHNVPIAVLIGSHTGSSGECVVVSFIGNAMTKIFGQPTWGLTTGNGSFNLPDGARMMLASTRMADRNGKVYYGSIEPDERLEKNKNTKDDTEIQTAVNWILNRK